MQNKNFTIKEEWIAILDQFSFETRAAVLAAVIDYARKNVMPQNLTEAAKMAFLFIKIEIDKSRKRSEAIRLRLASKSGEKQSQTLVPQLPVTESEPEIAEIVPEPQIPSPPKISAEVKSEINVKSESKTKRRSKKSQVVPNRRPAKRLNPALIIRNSKLKLSQKRRRA